MSTHCDRCSATRTLSTSGSTGERLCNDCHAQAGAERLMDALRASMEDA